MGHFTWMAMMRRPCLCVFMHGYWLVHAYGRGRLRITNQLRRELELARGLLPMLFADLGLPWSPTVHACDASLYGMGVVSRQLDPEEVGRIGRITERWRHRLEGGLDARVHALSGARDVPDPALRRKVLRALDAMPLDKTCHTSQESPDRTLEDFLEVDPKLLSESCWDLVYRTAWRLGANILRLEAKAIEWVIRHLGRSAASQNHRHLIFSDKLARGFLVSQRGGPQQAP